MRGTAELWLILDGCQVGKLGNSPSIFHSGSLREGNGLLSFAHDDFNSPCHHPRSLVFAADSVRAVIDGRWKSGRAEC